MGRPQYIQWYTYLIIVVLSILFSPFNHILSWYMCFNMCLKDILLQITVTYANGRRQISIFEDLTADLKLTRAVNLTPGRLRVSFVFFTGSGMVFIRRASLRGPCDPPGQEWRVVYVWLRQWHVKLPNNRILLYLKSYDEFHTIQKHHSYTFPNSVIVVASTH